MTQSVIEPIVGQWYQDMLQRVFEVVALDDDTVEIQYYDGDVEELDMETWHLLNVTVIAEPGNAAAPYDDLELDEFGGDLEERLNEDWHQMLDKF
jgi:hypothetical protein